MEKVNWTEFWKKQNKKKKKEKKNNNNNNKKRTLVFKVAILCERHHGSVGKSTHLWCGRSPDGNLQEPKISCYDWLILRVVCLGKACYSHLLHSTQVN